VGNLDPIDTSTGLASRLRHLGHTGDEDEHVAGRPWMVDSAPNMREHALRRGVVSFQRDNDLEVDGQVDEEILQKVHDAHGC
jgi:hypothetical protein